MTDSLFFFSCSKLQGLSLTANLGDQLVNLQHLKHLYIFHSIYDICLQLLVSLLTHLFLYVEILV